MSGIFGNHPDDRAMERELDAHLDAMFKEVIYTCIACLEKCGEEDVRHEADFWQNVPARIKHPCVCHGCSELRAVRAKYGLDEL